MDIRERAMKLKSVSPFAAAASADTRNRALKAVAGAISENKAEIIAENEKDMAAAAEKQVPAPILKRLRFDEAKIDDVLGGIDELISLSDP